MKLVGKQAWGRGFQGGFGSLDWGGLILELWIRTCFRWGFIESLEGLFPCQPGDVVVLCLPFLV